MGASSEIKETSLCNPENDVTDKQLTRSLKEMSVQMEEVSERRRVMALLACIVSVAFYVLLGTAAFLCAAITDSSAGYAFALDCVLDAVASALVLWRFYGSRSTYSDAKESIACVSLGVLFCMAAVSIVSKAAYDLADHTIPRKVMYIFILAGVGGLVNSVLGIFKYILGRKLNSQALILEAVNTCLSAFLSLMLTVSDILYFYHPSAWTIDPITSIVVAIILLACGIKVLCQKRRRDAEVSSPLLNGNKV